MNSLKNKKKRAKSNWMKGFIITSATKEEREANMIDRARIERCIDYKERLHKQRG